MAFLHFVYEGVRIRRDGGPLSEFDELKICAKDIVPVCRPVLGNPAFEHDFHRFANCELRSLNEIREVGFHEGPCPPSLRRYVWIWNDQRRSRLQKFDELDDASNAVRVDRLPVSAGLRSEERRVGKGWVIT